MPSSQQDFERFVAWLHRPDHPTTSDVRRFANLVLANFDEVADRARQHNQRAIYLVEQARQSLITTPDTPPELEAEVEAAGWPWRRLRHLTLGPFRGFRTAEVLDLQSRIVLFYGPNGSGKSSVCEGLEYALLGTVQEADSKRIDERTYLSNLHAGRFEPPALTATDHRNREVPVAADLEMFRFCFVEKNRIDAFSRIAARPAGSRTELIAALFGMDDFNGFVSHFNDSVDSQLVLATTKQTALATLRAALVTDQAAVDGEADTLHALDQEEAALAASYTAGMTYSDLKALFGTPESPGRLRVLEEAVNAVPPTRIGITRQGFADQLRAIERIYQARSGTVAVLQARSSQVSFKALYQAVSELQEEVGDRCPACDTPLTGEIHATSNPYMKAADGLRELRELGELEEERDTADDDLADALRELRGQLGAITDFLAASNEQETSVARSVSSLIATEGEDWWSPLSTARREQEAVLEQDALEDILAIVDRIERQDAASLLATQERERNIVERDRLNEFRLSVQAQDSKRGRAVESIAGARTRIETFETTNAQLILDAAQEARDIERDAPIKVAYDSFLERLRAFRNELPGTLMAGLNDMAMALYNGFNREDRAEDKLAALYLPLTGDQKIEIAFCGNPRRRVDALHVLSEGHIRCLGLAILLAKAQSSDCPLIIFDDAINAIDHDHRAGIRETVFESDHFTDAQLIVTCHSNEFIKDIEQHLRPEYRQDYRCYLLRPHIGDHCPRVTTNLPRNYVTRARAAKDLLDDREALAQGRRALEMLSEKVWKWLVSHDQGILSVQLAGVGAEVGLRNLCEALRKRLTDATTFGHPNKPGLLTAYDRILGIPSTNLVWNYLNKGTHEEADRDDFDAPLVESVVLTLEELDSMDLRNGR
jgi:AAA domain/AAA domain, putative AbiEii toxin, Type IV TA system